MESKYFSVFALPMTLILILLTLLTVTVQGANIKNVGQSLPESTPAVSTINLDQLVQTPIKLDHTSEISFTPVVTLYFPIIMWSPWQYERECEFPDYYTVGQLIFRSKASGKKVHGQFGTTPSGQKRSGYIEYRDIDVTRDIDHLYLRLKYSKYTQSLVPIDIYIDDETTPRASFYIENQLSWNIFSWKILDHPSNAVDLKSIERGKHNIRFYTEGQTDGVADCDKFILTDSP